MRWKWNSGRKKARVEFPCVCFICIIKEEIFLFLCFSCAFFSPFSSLSNQRTVSSRDCIWQDRFKSYYTLQRSSFSWRALTTSSMWGHLSYYIASTYYNFWNVVTQCKWKESDLKCCLVIVKYSSVWKRKLLQWLSHVPLQWESDRPLCPFSYWL